MPGIGVKRRIWRWAVIAFGCLLVAGIIAYRHRWSSAPSNLDECHERLMREMPKDELEKIKAMTNRMQMVEYHFGVGLWMRNEWGLWGGGPLYWHFRTKGLRHPDDMSGYILETFWCRLHNEPYPDLKKQTAYLDAFYRAQASPPDSARTPDGAKIDFRTAWIGTDSNGVPFGVHIGRSQGDGTLWVYEWNKGVYAPTGDLRESILTSDFWKSQVSNQTSNAETHTVSESQR